MKSLKRGKNDSPGKSFTDNCGRLLESSASPIQVQLEQASGDGSCPSTQVVIHLLDGSKRSGQQHTEEGVLQPPGSSVPVDAGVGRSGFVSPVSSMDALCQHMARFFTAASPQDSGEQGATDCPRRLLADECLQKPASEAVSTSGSNQSPSHQEADKKDGERRHCNWPAVRCEDSCSGVHPATGKAVITNGLGGVGEAEASRDSDAHYTPDMEITGKFLKLTVAACSELQSPLVSFNADTELWSCEESDILHGMMSRLNTWPRRKQKRERE